MKRYHINDDTLAETLSVTSNAPTSADFYELNDTFHSYFYFDSGFLNVEVRSPETVYTRTLTSVLESDVIDIFQSFFDNKQFSIFLQDTTNLKAQTLLINDLIETTTQDEIIISTKLSIKNAYTVDDMVQIHDAFMLFGTGERRVEILDIEGNTTSIDATLDNQLVLVYEKNIINKIVDDNQTFSPVNTNSYPITSSFLLNVGGNRTTSTFSASGGKSYNDGELLIGTQFVSGDWVDDSSNSSFRLRGELNTYNSVGNMPIFTTTQNPSGHISLLYDSTSDIATLNITGDSIYFPTVSETFTLSSTGDYFDVNFEDVYLLRDSLGDNYNWNLTIKTSSTTINKTYTFNTSSYNEFQLANNQINLFKSDKFIFNGGGYDMGVVNFATSGRYLDQYTQLEEFPIWSEYSYNILDNISDFTNLKIYEGGEIFTYSENVSGDASLNSLSNLYFYGQNGIFRTHLFNVDVQNNLEFFKSGNEIKELISRVANNRKAAYESLKEVILPEGTLTKIVANTVTQGTTGLTDSGFYTNKYALCFGADENESVYYDNRFIDIDGKSKFNTPNTGFDWIAIQYKTIRKDIKAGSGANEILFPLEPFDDTNYAVNLSPNTNINGFYVDESRDRRSISIDSSFGNNVPLDYALIKLANDEIVKWGVEAVSVGIIEVSVVFATPYEDVNYAISLTGTENRNIWWEDKTVSGFKIKISLSGYSGEVSWTTCRYGEFFI